MTGRRLSALAAKAAAVLLMLCAPLLFMQGVRAAEPYKLEIAQTVVQAPKTVVYFRLVDVEGNDRVWTDLDIKNVSASLDGAALETVSVERQADSEYGINYYYLLDVSSSSPQAAFASVKEGILQHISSKGSRDRVLVIAFGEQVRVVLDGSESTEEAREILGGLRPNEGQTRLYNALAKAVELAKAVDDRAGSRPVVMLVTDGYDESTGVETRDEALSALKDNGLPLYAFAYSGGRASFVDALGELARASGGSLRTVGASDGASVILDTVAEHAYTYRAEFSAKTNVLEGSAGTVELQVNCEGDVYRASGEAVFAGWIKDETPPDISSARAQDRSTVAVEFSENVSGADRASAYLLKDEQGRDVAVESVVYNELSHTALLRTRDTLYRGDYTLECIGIKDVSREQNPLSGQYAVDASDIPVKGAGYFFKTFWYIPLAVVVLAAVAAATILIRSKRKKTGGGRDEGGTAPSSGANPIPGGSVVLPDVNSLAVEITIIDRNGLKRKVFAAVAGAYFIGRDPNLCDLCIEDKRLSRQHCALMYENGILKIQDLGSTNGTRLNGIPVSNPRSISDADVIEAANTRIRVRRR